MRRHHGAGEPGYTATARVLHWVTAVLILLMIPVGIIIANEWGGPAQTFLYNLHKSIGATLIPIVIVRLIYRLMNPPPPLPDDIPGNSEIRGRTRPIGRSMG